MSHNGQMPLFSFVILVQDREADGVVLTGLRLAEPFASRTAPARLPHQLIIVNDEVFPV